MALKKFKKAQELYIETAKNELRTGKKVTHWIWFIFPQLKGLGKSFVSNYYGLNSVEETREYFNDKYLKRNLIDCFKIVFKYTDYELLLECLGELDTQKLHSCVTLFYVATRKKLFKKIIDKFFNGFLDKGTVLLLDAR